MFDEEALHALPHLWARSQAAGGDRHHGAEREDHDGAHEADCEAAHVGADPLCVTRILPLTSLSQQRLALRRAATRALVGR